MNFWHRITARLKLSSYEGQVAINRSYREVFRGNPTREQQEAVLANLAARCGWNQVTLPNGASDRDIWFAEGKRAAFSEIFAQLSLSPDDVFALENAARHEALSIHNDSNTGNY